MPDNRLNSFTPERVIPNPALINPAPPPATTHSALQNVNNSVTTSPRSFVPLPLPITQPLFVTQPLSITQPPAQSYRPINQPATVPPHFAVPITQFSSHPTPLSHAAPVITPRATAENQPQGASGGAEQQELAAFQRDEQTHRVLKYRDNLREHFETLLDNARVRYDGASSSVTTTARELARQVDDLLLSMPSDTEILRSTQLQTMKTIIRQMIDASLHESREVSIPQSLNSAPATLQRVGDALRNFSLDEQHEIIAHQTRRGAIQREINQLNLQQHDRRTSSKSNKKRRDLVTERDRLDTNIESLLSANPGMAVRRLLLIMTDVGLTPAQRFRRAHAVCEELGTRQFSPLLRELLADSGFYAAVHRLEGALPDVVAIDNIQLLANRLNDALRHENRVMNGFVDLENVCELSRWQARVTADDKQNWHAEGNWNKEVEQDKKYQQRENMLRQENADLAMREMERQSEQEEMDVDVTVHTSDHLNLSNNGVQQSAISSLGHSNLSLRVPRDEFQKYYNAQKKGQQKKSEAIIQEWARRKRAVVEPLNAQRVYTTPDTGEHYHLEVIRDVNALTAAPARDSQSSRESLSYSLSQRYSQPSTQDTLRAHADVLGLSDTMPVGAPPAPLSLPTFSQPTISETWLNPLRTQEPIHNPLPQSTPSTSTAWLSAPPPQLFTTTLAGITARAPLPSETLNAPSSRSRSAGRDLTSLFRGIALAETRHRRDASFLSQPIPNRPAPDDAFAPQPGPSEIRADSARHAHARASFMSPYRGRDDAGERYMINEQGLNISARGAEIYSLLPNLRPAIDLLYNLVADVHQRIIHQEPSEEVRLAIAYCTGIPVDRITTEIYTDFSIQIHSMMQQIETFLRGGRNVNQLVNIQVPENNSLFAATLAGDSNSRIWLSQFVADQTTAELMMTLGHEFSHMDAMAHPTEDFVYVTQEGYSSYGVHDVENLVDSLTAEVAAIANSAELRAEYIHDTMQNLGTNYRLDAFSNIFNQSSARGAAYAVENNDQLRYYLVRDTADLLLFTILRISNRAWVNALPPQERNIADPLAVLADIHLLQNPEHIDWYMQRFLNGAAFEEIELSQANTLITEFAAIALPYPNQTARWLETDAGQALPQFMARLYQHDPINSASIIGMINCLLTTLIENGGLSGNYVQQCIFPIPYTMQFYTPEQSRQIWDDTLINHWAELLCSYQRTLSPEPQKEKMLELVRLLVRQSCRYQEHIPPTTFYAHLINELHRRMWAELNEMQEISPIPTILPTILPTHENFSLLARVQNWYVLIENNNGNFIRAYLPSGETFASDTMSANQRDLLTQIRLRNSPRCILRQRPRGREETEFFYDAIDRNSSTIRLDQDDNNLARTALASINSVEPTQEIIILLTEDLLNAQLSNNPDLTAAITRPDNSETRQ